MKNNNLPVIYLVSCVKAKSDEASPAKDLYRSVWFKSARSFVEASGSLWFILSAEHGLLLPEKRIEPYERTLVTMPAGERRAWSARVADQILAQQLPPSRISVLAGIKYREFLVPLLEKHGHETEEPLARLGIGSQIQWLKNQVRSRSL